MYTYINKLKINKFLSLCKNNSYNFCIKGKSIEEIKKYWDENSDNYLSQDSGANGFYYTLINMLKIEKRMNILEVGAGGGFLYNHSLNRKHPNSNYYATDLSDSMLGILCKRIGVEYKPNQLITIPNYNLHIEKANGEKLHYKNEMFDCYIANLCLQITTNPEKMIQEANRVLQPGGYAGFTVWGDKQRSRFFTLVPSILHRQFGIKLPKVRSNFHLNDKQKLINMLEQFGFTNIVCWNQFQPFPYVDKDDIQTLFTHPIVKDSLAECGDKKEEVKQALLEAFENILLHEREPVGLDGLMIIAKKK
ncbi:UbiE/COQ5 methyltransferase (macronuclear) [Tetrahymena thermophila SB210]|uniref:UbiE/COQ5 methyltransferase n=1 Tax=Tetrahymena thermophila (strain SB210) TaxID=312017 RepID=W7XIC4_TETTS|nr:UbiE/COQ5 methyltransferase [Tetrahymena thermophila SB210]EWS73174.1 UbiE/COQ5 methyltransferase [Tetrahymena thermophila SB210]|eukprot:XP_012654294.1 UbiE/COQ5 methyltransferase [Tetrahymena thermophila SB210]